jgi:hypothetical protein
MLINLYQKLYINNISTITHIFVILIKMEKILQFK